MVAMQAEVPIKLSAFCRVHGDVVLEFIHIGDNMEDKETMFRVMFNTAFVQSNILGLNRDDIDVAWNVNNQFPRDFRAEVLNSPLPICLLFSFSLSMQHEILNIAFSQKKS
jgi:formin 2